MKSYIKDNSGFSLIEIIVAMGISAFVILAVYMLMNTASVSYRDTTEDISGQKEVMQSMNFIFDKLAEAKDYRSFKQNFTVSSGVVEGLVLLVSNTVYDGNEPEDVTSFFVFVPKDEGGRIYYMRVDEAYNALSDTAIDNYVKDARKNIHLLADNVKVFSIEAPTMIENNPIRVTVEVEGVKTQSSYSETKVVIPRNYKEK